MKAYTILFLAAVAYGQQHATDAVVPEALSKEVIAPPELMEVGDADYDAERSAAGHPWWSKLFSMLRD